MMPATVTTGEGIQLGTAIVLTITLAVVGWYAWETRRQAEATRRIAEASMRPVLEQWIEQTPLVDDELVVHYRNFGNGPAANLSWEMEPTGESRTRVGMGIHDAEAPVKFKLADTQLRAVACEYQDASGNFWVSRLEFVERNGMLENGSSTHSARERARVVRR